MFIGKNFALFGKTKQLENKIDEFLDRILEASLVFKRVIKIYLEMGAGEDLDEVVEHLSDIEGEVDTLRRGIEVQLYEENLIPDLRADVLSLVEDLDWLLDEYEKNAYRLLVETPEIRADLRSGFLDLSENVACCVESVVMASRAFFKDIASVRNHRHKVVFYESEADKTSLSLKKAIFASDLTLEKKTHLRFFVDSIDDVANEAEDISDWLAIYVIKRSI